MTGQWSGVKPSGDKGMNKIDYAVDHEGLLISPNIHDFELRRMEFEGQRAALFLAPPLKQVSLVIHIDRVDRIAYVSDTVQNVIYDAYLFISDQDNLPICAKAKDMLRRQRPLSPREILLYLQPAAGIEFAVIGAAIAFNVI